jgi:hypothetical protein
MPAAAAAGGQVTASNSPRVTHREPHLFPIICLSPCIPRRDVAVSVNLFDRFCLPVLA